jgi:hypothetical protein
MREGVNGRQQQDNNRGEHRPVVSDTGMALNTPQGSRVFVPEAILANVREVLAHRTIVADPKRVVADQELQRLEAPLAHRMQSGLLSPDRLIGFVSGITNGGMRLDDFTHNPCMPMEIDDVVAIKDRKALPPFLSEREIDPTAQFADSLNRQKIVSSIFYATRKFDSDLPVYFLGSAAAGAGIPSDIDIGTSIALMRQNLEGYGHLFQCMRGNIVDARALGNGNHVGVQFDHMALALGVSVSRYGCAYRFSGQQAFIIEAA